MGTNRFKLVFSGLLLAMLLASLDQTIVATALPTIVRDLGSTDQLSWVVTAYLLGATVSMPLWGRASDLYGRKPLFVAAIVVFLTGSALSGLAGTLGQLIGFRALQGLGAGGLMTLAMAIVGELVPGRERGRYQGYIQIVFIVASVAGPLLGGLFADHASWRWVFYVNLPIGAVTLALITTSLHLPVERRPVKLDYLGAALLAGALTCLLLATTRGTDVAVRRLRGAAGGVHRPGAPRAGARAAAAAVPAAGVRRRLRGAVHDHARADGRDRLPAAVPAVRAGDERHRVRLPAAAGAARRHAQHDPLGPRDLQDRPLQALPAGGPGDHGARPGRALDARRARARRRRSSRILTFFGLGFGLVSQVLTTAIQNAVDRRDLGIATASANLFRSLGGAVGAAAFGAVYAGASVFLYAAPAAVIGLLIVLALEEVPLGRMAVAR